MLLTFPTGAVGLFQLPDGRKKVGRNLAATLKDLLDQTDLAHKIIDDGSDLIIVSEDYKVDALVHLIKQTLNDFDARGYIYNVGISSVYRTLADLPVFFQDARRLAQSNLVLSSSTVVYADQKLSFTKSWCATFALYCRKLCPKHYDQIGSRRFVCQRIPPDACIERRTGVTFNECLTRQRINEAKRLLAQGNALIYEVAMKVGHNDAKYFSQVFKRAPGLPNRISANEGTKAMTRIRAFFHSIRFRIASILFLVILCFCSL